MFAAGVSGVRSKLLAPVLSRRRPWHWALRRLCDLSPLGQGFGFTTQSSQTITLLSQYADGTEQHNYGIGLTHAGDGIIVTPFARGSYSDYVEANRSTLEAYLSGVSGYTTLDLSAKLRNFTHAICLSPQAVALPLSKCRDKISMLAILHSGWQPYLYFCQSDWGNPRRMSSPARQTGRLISPTL